jgi:hypothetical protein
MANETGSATNQKIFEAMKNMRRPERKTRVILRLGNLGPSRLANAIELRVRFTSGRNGVNPAEPAVKINVGAAL